MHIFEKLSEFRYEQLVFCHDKATGLKALLHFATPPLVLASAVAGCVPTTPRTR